MIFRANPSLNFAIIWLIHSDKVTIVTSFQEFAIFLLSKYFGSAPENQTILYTSENKLRLIFIKLDP